MKSIVKIVAKIYNKIMDGLGNRYIDEKQIHCSLLYTFGNLELTKLNNNNNNNIPDTRHD